jgi:F0F1-type ATP synthase membrane subunit b/b'
MKRRFAVFSVAALVAVLGAASCQTVEDEVRNRAQEEVDRQRQWVEEEVDRKRTRAEDRVAEEATRLLEDGQ